MAEAGFPGIDIDTWFGLEAPLGTPPDVIRKLANHPLTNSGIEGFLKDWKATGQSIL